MAVHRVVEFDRAVVLGDFQAPHVAAANYKDAGLGLFGGQLRQVRS